MVPFYEGRFEENKMIGSVKKTLPDGTVCYGEMNGCGFRPDFYFYQLEYEKHFKDYDLGDYVATLVY